jgi:hypothetical protein
MDILSKGPMSICATEGYAWKVSFERSLQGRVDSVFPKSCTEITTFQACEDGALQKVDLDLSVGGIKQVHKNPTRMDESGESPFSARKVFQISSRELSGATRSWAINFRTFGTT